MITAIKITCYFLRNLIHWAHMNELALDHAQSKRINIKL